jgi:hypothetical protein
MDSETRYSLKLLAVAGKFNTVIPAHYHLYAPYNKVSIL